MKIEIPSLEQALEERERRFMDAMEKAGTSSLGAVEDTPEFRLALKRRKAASYIREALKAEGLGDLAKYTRIERVAEES